MKHSWKHLNCMDDIRSKADLIQLNVSFYMNVKATKKMDMPIGRVLDGIRKCAYGEAVNKARKCLMKGDKDGYNHVKNQLPAVTFCGTFESGHKADECTHYNELMVIDIDKLNELEMERVKSVLYEDELIAAFWESPSGKGFKGLVHLDYSPELKGRSIMDCHKIAFRQLFTFLLANYDIELDKSGSDVCRLCYMSADEYLVIKKESKPFFVESVMTAEKKIDAQKGSDVATIKCIEKKDWNEIYGKATDYIYNKQNKNLLLYILRKLRKRNLSITDTWENWVKVAFAIASSVHPEKGRELFLDFCRLDGAKHDEAKSEHLIWDAYCKNQGKCSINSIIYLAGQKGVVLDR